MSKQNRDGEYESDDDNVHYADEEFHDEEEDGNGNEAGTKEEPPRREFKYSTANMKQTTNWKKWCLIFLTFLIMAAFMIALSILMQKIFFSDVSDNAPFVPEKDPNATFKENKVFINTACSRGTISSDEGRRCREACEPQFSSCCDPFNEFERPKAIGRVLSDSTFGENTTTPEKDLSQCSLDQELAGCVAYAKCQTVLTHSGNRTFDPAPATLSELCSEHRLKEDPVSCQQVCRPVRCCYSEGNDNCMADDFAICLDYAPCQNLRKGMILHTAPDVLDEMCEWQQPDCNTFCERAKCCGDPQSSCLQQNFMACLTYAPCKHVTRTNIELHPQFNTVPRPPDELLESCGLYHELMQRVPKEHLPATHSCMDLCSEVKCCWSHIPSENCFNKDPLGCLAWEQQCQILFE